MRKVKFHHRELRTTEETSPIAVQPGTPHRAELTGQSHAPRPAVTVAAIGVCTEIMLVLGLVRPLWLFGRRHAITTDEPLATLLGISGTGLATFVATLCVWIGGYAAVLWLVQRPLTAGARRALWWLPLLFAGTLLLVLPSSSKDVYHYVMEGRIVSEYGGNPLTLPPAAFANDPLYWVMSSWESTPSRYGPLFALVAGVVAFVGSGNLTATLLGFKLVSVASLFGTAWLCAATAGRFKPELSLPAFVLVAWNPLALYEAAANAHNDLLMVFFTALAFYLAGRGMLVWALPALALGVLVKYVVVLLAPLLIADCGPRRAGAGVRIAAKQAARGRGTGTFPENDRSFLRSVLFGVLLSVLLVILLYLPFWEGRRTFDALRSASGDMGSSVGWMLRQALKHRLGWEGARPVVMAILSTVFIAGYALMLWRAGMIHLLRQTFVSGKAEARTATSVALPIPDVGEPRTSDFGLRTLLLYLCTLSWWLWPWYALWLLPAAALLTDQRWRVLAAVITCAALAAYIPINFRIYFWGETPTDHMPLFAFLMMFLPPLAAMLWLRPWRAQRLPA